MDLGDLKHTKLAEHLQQLKGRVVLRGDNVKDGTGGYVLFTDQGASASHVTAAEVLDTISQLAGMSDEANGAVSACT